jgi:hypothetical protein
MDKCCCIFDLLVSIESKRFIASRTCWRYSACSFSNADVGDDDSNDDDEDDDADVDTDVDESVELKSITCRQNFKTFLFVARGLLVL